MADNQQPVIASLHDLEAGSIQLPTLEQAFGPSSLGILIVKDLPPSFQELRLKLLSYASHLAHLPLQDLDLLTNPASHYNVGWSHGKEALKPGIYDTMKGSYYASVISSELQSALKSASPDNEPAYQFPNIWPPESLLPGFRDTFEALCTLIIDIALLVARACDSFAAVHVEGYVSGRLERIVRESIAGRARLLHYFPPSLLPVSGVTASIAKKMDSAEKEDVEDDSWCALHVDDGCLTGLTSALFVDESTPLMPPQNFQAVTSPDPQAGLHIQSRKGEVIKVNIPADCLAFQTGSALELMTGGALKAVPHFVRGPSTAQGGKGREVARNTLAVFMQPRMDEVLEERSGMTFGEHIKLSDESHA